MATKRNKKGQFVKGGKSHRRGKSKGHSLMSNAPRRRSPRKNAYFNPPKRHRSYRRNPALFSGGGILGVNLKDIAFAGAGFIAPPAIEGFLKGMLPASLTGNTFGKYAVKGGIVAGLSLLGGKFISREAGKFIALGGALYLVSNLVVEFVPQLTSGMQGYMNPGQTFKPMGRSPLLGKYVSGNRGMGTAILTQSVPSRLDPGSRF